MSKITHLNKRGEIRMVDVSAKPVTFRRAVAVAEMKLTPAIAKAIRSDEVAKGNVVEVARVGAIQAAKKTADLVPLCHPIPLSNISGQFQLDGTSLRITSEVTAEAKTGVEMEALTAASVAALVVYDMCKGIDKGMKIGPIVLLEKEGGKSGHYKRK